MVARLVSTPAAPSAGELVLATNPDVVVADGTLPPAELVTTTTGEPISTPSQEG